MWTDGCWLLGCHRTLACGIRSTAATRVVSRPFFSVLRGLSKRLFGEMVQARVDSTDNVASEHNT
jgi:hypothetical protein